MSKLTASDLALAPLEGLGVGQVGGDEGVDGVGEFGHAAEAGTAEGLSGQDAKPDFDLVNQLAEVGVK
jgi:hypothetical protein